MLWSCVSHAKRAQQHEEEGSLSHKYSSPLHHKTHSSSSTIHQGSSWHVTRQTVTTRKAHNAYYYYYYYFHPKYHSRFFSIASLSLFLFAVMKCCLVCKNSCAGLQVPMTLDEDIPSCVICSMILFYYFLNFFSLSIFSLVLFQAFYYHYHHHNHRYRYHRQCYFRRCISFFYFF